MPIETASPEQMMIVNTEDFADANLRHRSSISEIHDSSPQFELLSIHSSPKMEATAIKSFWRNRRLRSLVLVIVASILEKADMAAVPAVYREIGLELHASPSALGSFALIRSLTQAVCSPFAGYLAKRYRRTTVIAAGALISTIATFCVGTSTTFSQIALSMAVSAVGIAVTWPAIQSLVADATDDTNRGMTFGWLQLTGHAGSFFGGFVSVLLAGTSVMGVSGWRVSFILLSILSSFITCTLYFFADDPGSSSSSSSSEVQSARRTTYMEDLREQFEDAKRVLQVKTFQIIVAEAVVGAFAWSTFSFAPMWLELIGFSHGKTATIIAFFIVAGSIGGLFGGWIGDRMAGWFPDTGRIIVAQVCTGIAVPFTAVLLLALPVDPSTALLHGTVLFAMGLFISWNTPSTNAPLMAEVVPQQSRTNVYALERTFASVVAAFGPPLAGLLSERMYGFVPIPKGTSHSVGVTIDRQNASALGKAIFTSMGLPFAICCMIYSLLYRTYPRDRDQVRAAMYLMESDVEKDCGAGVKLEDSHYLEPEQASEREDETSSMLRSKQGEKT
ncbi:hypothetical protein Mapa_011266 [Marchantia paleacea]|nr:hypothetical protein Mapa_011266 [Marchantia paleacea]